MSEIKISVVFNSQDMRNVNNISYIFSDEQLYVLGVKREYMDYFQQMRNKIRAEKLRLIKENVKSFSPDRKNQIRNLDFEEHFLYVHLSCVHRFSIMTLQNPEEFKKYNLYWWMQESLHLFDTPELEQFKFFPDLHWNDSDILVPQLVVKKYIDKT